MDKGLVSVDMTGLGWGILEGRGQGAVLEHCSCPPTPPLSNELLSQQVTELHVSIATGSNLEIARQYVFKSRAMHMLCKNSARIA